MKINLFVLALLILLTSCTSEKEVFISEVDHFVEDVEKKHEKYDDKDWERKNKEFERLLENDFEAVEENLSREEKVHLATQLMTYTSLQATDRMADHLEVNSEEYDREYGEIMEETADLLRALGEEFNREIMPELEAMAPQFESLGKEFIQKLKKDGSLDNIMNALEDWAKKMEEIGEEMEKEGKVDIQVEKKEEEKDRIAY